MALTTLTELELARVAPQRGWEALKAIGWSAKKPLTRNKQVLGLTRKN